MVKPTMQRRSYCDASNCRQTLCFLFHWMLQPCACSAGFTSLNIHKQSCNHLKWISWLAYPTGPWRAPALSLTGWAELETWAVRPLQFAAMRSSVRTARNVARREPASQTSLSLCLSTKYNPQSSTCESSVDQERLITRPNRSKPYVSPVYPSVRDQFEKSEFQSGEFSEHRTGATQRHRVFPQHQQPPQSPVPFCFIASFPDSFKQPPAGRRGRDDGRDGWWVGVWVGVGDEKRNRPPSIH